MNDPLSNRHNEGMESPAYASAESSPTQSMATSLSMHSFQNGCQQQFEGSPTRSGTMPVSQSMNCFADKSPSASQKSLTNYINLATIPSSMSVSDIDTLAKLEELNMQAFTSLPPVTNSPKSGETVKAVIERTVKAELEKQQTSPKISPSRSSVFSMLGRIFKSASKSNNLGEEKDKSKGNTSPTSSTASSSSPNPECSPFKLLERPQMNEDLEQLRKREITEAIKDEKVNEESASTIEKLVQLNEEKSSTHIDQDTILSPKSVVPVEEISAGEAQSTVALESETRVDENMKVPASSQEFCNDLNLNIAASAALAAAEPCEQQQQVTSSKGLSKSTSKSNTSDDHQRFTKNASTSSIHNDLKAILEESKEKVETTKVEKSKKSKQSAEGHSPASVNSSSSSGKKKNSSSKKKSSSSSLSASVVAAAEASDDANKTTSTTAGGETSLTQPVSPPKPQREKKHRSKQSKSSEKKSSSAIKSPETNQLNVLEMLMKTAMEAAVATTTTTTTVTKVAATKETTAVKRSAHRYSREFLLRIRDERSKLIDNICPDIFRTHAYCISGMFWDPEKYFNAILHGERLHDFVNNNHTEATMHPYANKTNLSTSSASSVPYTKSYVQRPKQSPQQYYNNKLMSPRNNYNNTNARQQWAKNNKQSQLNRSKNGNELLQNLISGNVKSESIGNSLSDNYLLDLLKRGNSASNSTNAISTSPKQNSGIDLMDMLNKKHASNLFNNETSVAPVKTASQPRHTPLILTAQELEFSQLFSANTAKKQSLSPCSQRTSGSSPSLSSSLSPTSLSSGVVKSVTEGDLNLFDINSSDAYKQLVKNLNNHPLSASSTSVVAKTTVDDLFNSVMAQKREESQQKDGTNLLKKLLHLNLSQSEEKPSRMGKNNNYYNNRNQRQLKPSSKSSSTYARRSHNSSFNNDANLEDLILNKLKHNSPELVSSASQNNNKSEQDHFKILLDKLVPSLSSHLVANSSSSSNKPDDIMKWFRDSKTAQNTTL